MPKAVRFKSSGYLLFHVISIWRNLSRTETETPINSLAQKQHGRPAVPARSDRPPMLFVHSKMVCRWVGRSAMLIETAPRVRFSSRVWDELGCQAQISWDHEASVNSTTWYQDTWTWSDISSEEALGNRAQKASLKVVLDSVIVFSKNPVRDPPVKVRHVLKRHSTDKYSPFGLGVCPPHCGCACIPYWRVSFRRGVSIGSHWTAISLNYPWWEEVCLPLFDSVASLLVETLPNKLVLLDGYRGW